MHMVTKCHTAQHGIQWKVSLPCSTLSHLVPFLRINHCCLFLVHSLKDIIGIFKLIYLPLFHRIDIILYTLIYIIFFSFICIPWRSSISMHIEFLIFPPWWFHSILLYKYSTIYLTSPLLMDIRLFPTLFYCKYCCSDFGLFVGLYVVLF